MKFVNVGAIVLGSMYKHPASFANAADTINHEEVQVTSGGFDIHWDGEVVTRVGGDYDGRSTRSRRLKTKNEPSKDSHVWTKLGLEQIPWAEWTHFTKGDGKMSMSPSLYIKGFPFPGDFFTKDHYEAWLLKVDSPQNSSSSLEDLVKAGYITYAKDKAEAMLAYNDYTSVPTLFSDPIILKETPIDYRLQYAADIGSNMIGERASLGRLVNPAGRRLREHFYRFPDQCDATPIALEVFLRLFISDQIEALFNSKTIGLWQDLFTDLEVERRPFNAEELSVARWYGQRYAESYLHKITNGWVYPLGKVQNIDTYMIAVGLNPLDTTEDPSTPAGLGNLVGRRVTEWMNDNDGLKRDMDFVDVEGLQRIADRHLEQAWHQWKPSFAGSKRFQGMRNGIVTQQTFVSPSLGIFSFLYKNEDDFIALKLESTVPPLNVSEEAYIERSKEFLKLQDEMTDREKAVAELSNNKINGSVFLILAYEPLLRQLAREEDYSKMYDEFSLVTSGCAEYAAGHAAWRHKRTYLAGRPATVIRHLVDKNKLDAHPKAKDFRPLIPAGDHPEYPSGTCAIYTAFAQAADDWFLEKFNFTEASMRTGPLNFTIPASKFYWTDGPSQEITLEYESLNEWIQELPKSRVYAGVHFMNAGIVGLALGKEVGHACSSLLKRLRDGDMTATYSNADRTQIKPFNN